ncbi:MAG: type II toxin-antitoxin system VapC family toxin [Pyrinomonadaceae bacterium]|nr:type II toxin-antitoxin system VapC family toxin [Pyrinomonadaceae bacterium]
MGSLSVPASGVIYVDTAPFIYTVERHADYEQLLLPLWEALDGGAIEVVTSELTLLETLVKPLRDGDQALAGDYEKLLTATTVRMLPVTASVLRDAARIRAAINLKTPDAIHAATALAAGCVQFITNDAEYRKHSSLSVVILKEAV